MISMTIGNLTRQFKALELLEQLLEEEYLLLQARDTDAISSMEFSIHELLRQIAVERLGLRDRLGLRARESRHDSLFVTRRLRDGPTRVRRHRGY